MSEYLHFFIMSPPGACMAIIAQLMANMVQSITDFGLNISQFITV
ncbi:hypothetical protein D1BOALGB6SA_367 [Olavius sp. associated proteobacterium Delta 1]|nr:hypothetical protein D1BOALGB6SA_367 [Olavius sp. associated proteobacterium Delta 1]